MHGIQIDNLQKTTEYTNSFLNWTRGRGRIIIIIHDHPDPDSLASAMALRRLFTMKLNRDAVIAFSGMISRGENIAMARELEIFMTPMEIVDLDDYSMVCMLDTQPGTGNNSLPPGARVDLVIDHHPIRESSLKCKWVDIREDYGATATILYEYLKAQDVFIGATLATALFYAIKSETQDLGREACRADRNAYLNLFPYTNKTLLYGITHPRLTPAHFEAMHAALENTAIYANVLVIRMGDIPSPEVVAEMADYLVRLEGIEVAIGIGRNHSAMILSMRTTRHDLNAGELMQRLVSGRGSAGGHGMTAGGRIEQDEASPDDFEDLEDSLTRRLLEELEVPPCQPLPLIGR